MTTPQRGHVYRADLGYGAKPWRIVSNNPRNRRLSDVLAVRLTTTVKDLPTWVPLTAGDPLRGHVNTDNIETLAKTELGDDLGALSPDSVMNVNRALAVSLALPL